jgi:hypothetical protein
MTPWQKGVALAWTDIGQDTTRVRIVSIQPQ